MDKKIIIWMVDGRIPLPRMAIEAETIENAKEILLQILGGTLDTDGRIEFNLRDIKKDKRWKEIPGCGSSKTHLFVLLKSLHNGISHLPEIELFFEKDERLTYLNPYLIESILVKSNIK